MTISVGKHRRNDTVQDSCHFLFKLLLSAFCCFMKCFASAWKGFRQNPPVSLSHACTRAVSSKTFSLAIRRPFRLLQTHARLGWWCWFWIYLFTVVAAADVLVYTVQGDGSRVDVFNYQFRDICIQTSPHPMKPTSEVLCTNGNVLVFAFEKKLSSNISDLWCQKS